MKKQSGFSAIEALLILVIVAILGGTAWYVYNSHQKTQDIYANADSSNSSTVSAKTTVPLSWKILGSEQVTLDNKVDKADKQLFVDIEFTNPSKGSYNFNTDYLKLKNSTTNATIDPYSVYPEYYRNTTLTPLKSQAISAGEKLSGSMQYPVTDKDKGGKFTISYIDSKNKVNLSEQLVPKQTTITKYLNQ